MSVEASVREVREVASGKQVGPCEIDGCDERATLIVTWSIEGYGETTSWYCERHAPEAES